ncbi:hypothetical protein [Agrobacterium vitis]|uniref:hypothetical protein n=1 Tax=Agrobacterium vitis TaxID=373 RepID=UPI001572C6BC|nr:hypothetical protein [Agrobacterium vitis]NSY15064.1 hypothetical protein [Agrobacterium vitis]NSY24821.1 hypothetical protein [Agrobacterium vitis]NTA24354.1 hypothetical protein [Agrobacterium vitis]WEO74915.1 hypothetical protein G6L01_022980 [Agrobacterium vitis]
MTKFDKTETPTGLAPSADSPEQKRRKLLAGKGLMLFIVGIAALAAFLYVFIAVYGILSST